MLPQISWHKLFLILDIIKILKSKTEKYFPIFILFYKVSCNPLFVTFSTTSTLCNLTCLDIIMSSIIRYRRARILYHGIIFSKLGILQIDS